jgi:hypothetical protein
VRWLVSLTLLAWLLASASPAVSLGQSIAPARQRHPWARFEPGAWKLVRVVTETFDERGALANTSTTETKTTLKKVEDDGVTLLVETVVEIGGKRLDAEPQTIKQGLHGEPAGQGAKIKDAGAAKVTIEGREYPCRIEEVESTASNIKTLTKTYYSAAVAPYALRRESIATDVQTGATIGETEWHVAGLAMACRILRDIRRAAQVRSVYRHAKGTTTTSSITSIDVPGGIVCHTARELDGNSRLVRRSSLELVAYGVEPDDGRWGVWRRGRSGHRHRSTHYSPSYEE